MPYDFEVFDKRLGRLSKVPEVTVQSGGSISLNSAAAAALGNPEAVEMLFDRRANVVGVRGASPDAAHVYGMRVLKNRVTSLIACKAFFTHYDLPLGKSVRREVRMEDGILIIDLNDPGRVAVSGRRATVHSAANRQIPETRAASPLGDLPRTPTG